MHSKNVTKINLSSDSKALKAYENYCTSLGITIEHN